MARHFQYFYFQSKLRSGEKEHQISMHFVANLIQNDLYFKVTMYFYTKDIVDKKPRLNRCHHLMFFFRQ